MPEGVLRERLKGIRQAAGLSQARLSQELGYSKGWATKVESGRIGIGLDDAERWARACGHHATFLIRRDAAGDGPVSLAGLSTEEVEAIAEAARVLGALPPATREIFLRSLQSNNRVWAATLKP